MNEAVREYIQARIAIEDHGFSTRCWIWQLSLRPDGYGQGMPPGYRRPESAHRFTYREYVGEIPSGLHLDHLCRVRDCCNPDHLEPVTAAENTRRALPFRVHALREGGHCRHGHKLTADNILHTSSGRRCAECFRASKRRSYAKAGKFRKPTLNPHSHCKRGHELSPANTLVWRDGARRCLACNLQWRREKDDWKARHRRARAKKDAAAQAMRAGEAARSGQRLSVTSIQRTQQFTGPSHRTRAP